MAKKGSNKKQEVAEVKEQEIKDAPAQKKPKSIKDILEELSNDYFERFPNVDKFYAVESKSFFFRLNSARREASKIGSEVYEFNRNK